MSILKIGKLKHRVTLQEYTATRDSYGAELEAWVDIATVWASVEPLTGREYFQTQQINAEISTKVTIRFKAGVTAKMRLIYNDRVFEIISVINTEEKDVQLVLMCREMI